MLILSSEHSYFCVGVCPTKGCEQNNVSIMEGHVSDEIGFDWTEKTAAGYCVRIRRDHTRLF